MEGAPGSLLAQAMAAGSRSSSPNNRGAPPAAYLDVSGVLLSSSKSPAQARAQTAPTHQHRRARRSSPPGHHRRAQTAARQPGSTGPDTGSAAIRAAVRRRPRWNGSVAAPVAPSFEEALRAWQADVVAGAYAPRCLGSLAALRHSGHVNPAAVARRTSPSAGSMTVAPSSSCAPAGTAPAVFQGSGEDALQALEGLVARQLVARPLTLMQLQRGIRAISQLDSACQLAAICVLLRGGCWLAAMQVAYAEGLSMLSGVLVEMRALIELGMQWEDQHLAAAAWRWAPIDRDLFLHTFRQCVLTGQYQQLRRQLTRLQHMQAQQQQQPCTPLAAAGGGPAALWSCPELARAEKVMLTSIIDRYLESIAAADASAGQQPQLAAMCSVGCCEGLAGADRRLVILEEAAEAGPHNDDGSGSSSSSSRSSSRSTHVGPRADATTAPPEADSAAPGQQQQPQANVTDAAQAPQPPKQQQQPQPLDAGLQAPPPPAAQCSRPQSHQTSRRCSTARGSRPGTAGALNSAPLGQLQQQTRISDSSNVTPASGVQQGSLSAAAVDSVAGERLRPGSAAAAAGSGLSRLGTSNASPPSRGRPGSAVTASAGLAATSSGAADTWQRPGSAAATGAADANLCRLRDSCAQQRQGIEQWAEQLAHAASVQQFFGEASGCGRGGAATAASRPGSAAFASLGFVPNSRPGTALTAASSSRCSRPASALTQQPTGRCSLSSSCAAELLMSSSKALVSSPATRQPSSDASARSSAAASRPASQPGAAAGGDTAAAAGGGGSGGGSSLKQQPHTKLTRWASPSPVPHLPLLEAGIISPDPSDDGDDDAGSGGGAPAVAANPGAWLYGAVAHSRAPAAPARPGQPAKAAALGSLFGSSEPKQKGRTAAAPKPSGARLVSTSQQQQHKPGAAAAATKQQQHVPPTSSSKSAKADGVADSRQCPAAATSTAAVSAASMLKPVASQRVSSPVAAQPAAGAAAAGPPGPGVQAAASDQSPAAEPSSPAETLDQPPAAVAAGEATGAPVAGSCTSLSPAVVAAAAAADAEAQLPPPLPPAAAIVHAGPPTDSAQPRASKQSTTTAAEQSEVPATSSSVPPPGPDQFMVELAETMQQFQQQLKQQTARMAEELLALQVAGQTARQAGGMGSSSSRSASAAARQQQPCTSSRPANRGQPRSARLLQGHTPAAAAGAPADEAAAGLSVTPPQPLHAAAAALLACKCQLAAQLGGMTLLLEGEEQPSAADVAAYARYLGMDPQQDVHLLHIAEAALLAPLPAGWTVHLDARGNEFFFCSATQQSSYEHPMDAFYRQLYAQHKAADAVLPGAGCGPAAVEHQPQQH